MRKYNAIAIILALFMPIAGASLAGKNINEKPIKKLETMLSEVTQAMDTNNHEKVIALSQKLETIGFSYDSLPAGGKNENSPEQKLWLAIIVYRGIAYSSLKRYSDSIPCYKFYTEKCIGIKFPGEIILRHANAYMCNNQTKEALHILLDAEKKYKSHIDDQDLIPLYLEIGWYYYLLDDYDRAIEFCKRSLAREVDSFESNAAYIIGLALLAKNEDSSSLKWFFKGLDASCLYWISYNIPRRDTIDNFIEILNKKNKNATAQVMLWFLYKSLNDPSAKKYTSAIKRINIQNSLVLVKNYSEEFKYILAACYSQKGEYDKVAKYLYQIGMNNSKYYKMSLSDADFTPYYQRHGHLQVQENKVNISTNFSWNPDRSAFALNIDAAVIQLWNTDGAIKILRGHGEKINILRWSPDGGNLVSASWDKSFRLWIVTVL